MVEIKSFFTKGTERTIDAKKNIAIALLIKGLSFFVSLLYIPLLLNYLDETKYGIWVALSSIVAWISIADMGLGNGLKNKLAESYATNDVIRGKSLISTAYFYIALIFLFVSILFSIINNFIDWTKVLNVSNEYYHELKYTALVVIIALCIRFIFQLIVPILSAFQKTRYASIIDLVGQILALVVVWLLNLLNIKSLVLFASAITFIPIVVLVISSYHLFKRKYKEYLPSITFVKKRYLKDIFSVGIMFFFMQIAVIVIFQANNLLISNTMGPEMLTKYNIVYRFFGIASTFWGILMMPLWPAFTHAYTLNDTVWIRKVIHKCLLLFVISIVIISLMIVFGQDLIRLWTHKDLDITFPLIISLAIFTLISIWNNIWGYIVGAISKLRLGTITTFISMLLFFPLFFLFVNKYQLGLVGAILTTIVCISLSAIVSPIQVGYFIFWKKRNKILDKILR